MGHLLDILETVNGRWVAQIEVPQNLPTVHDNQKPTINSVVVPKPENAIWSALTVLPDRRNLFEIGQPNNYFWPGIMKAILNVPLLTGSNEATVLADLIVTDFTAVTVLTPANVVFETPYVENVRRRRSDSKWWQLIVNCPFYSESI